MYYLSIRTDRPEAELGLYDGQERVDNLAWPAHRQLAETIHLRIKQLLDSNSKSLKDLGGLVVYKGPGSFTGLRIGISVANALADGLKLPIVSGEGEGWLETALQSIMDGQNEELVIPAYGSPPHTTKPKH